MVLVLRESEALLARLGFGALRNAIVRCEDGALLIAKRGNNNFVRKGFVLVHVIQADGDPAATAADVLGDGEHVVFRREFTADPGAGLPRLPFTTTVDAGRGATLDDLLLGAFMAAEELLRGERPELQTPLSAVEVDKLVAEEFLARLHAGR